MLLLVEDDIDLAEMLGEYFRVQGYDVEAVHWGEDAVGACLRSNPDLVLLDIRLPDLDGFEVARRLRSNRRTESTPIIFLTEKRERADRLKGLGLGVQDYVTKPFDIQELRLRVRNALQRSDQSPLINPVTGLPQSTLLDEQLSECLGNPHWGLLLIRLSGLERFREQYGFLASDDTLRAAQLMIMEIVREIGSQDDFVGHLDSEDFLILTESGNLESLERKIRTRLQEALTYFYPLHDRPTPTQAPSEGSLAVYTSSLMASDSAYEDIGSLKRSLLSSLPA